MKNIALDNTPTQLPFIARIDTVVNLVGLSRANIYEQVKNGTFPLPRKLSDKATGWHTSDLKEWADNLPLSHSIRQKATKPMLQGRDHD